MKVSSYLFAMCFASAVAAHAATVFMDLPVSANLEQTSTIARQTGEDLLTKISGFSYGIYAGGNNNTLSNWPQNGEGTWVNNANVGSMTLCGRTGVAGDSFAMVLGGPQQGEVISSFSFSCSTPTSIITSFTMVLGIYDAAGTLVQGFSDTQLFTFGGTSETKTISLDLSATPLTWVDGYKLVAGVRGGPGPATSAYTIDNIQVSYETVAIPEPATAFLGFFGLGLFAKRRRKQ